MGFTWSRFIGLALVPILVGCGASGHKRTTAGSALIDQLNARRAAKKNPGSTVDPTAAVTREIVQKAGFAMVRVVGGVTGPTILIAKAKNRGYVSYANDLNQSVSFLGSGVSATRNLGHDLLAVDYARGDHLVTGGPVLDWDDQVTRTYEFLSESPDGKKITVQCDRVRNEKKVITILETPFTVYPIAENCVGDGVSFQNRYWASPKSGFVWKSEIWAGEKFPLLRIEVYEPFR